VCFCIYLLLIVILYMCVHIACLGSMHISRLYICFCVTIILNLTGTFELPSRTWQSKLHHHMTNGTPGTQSIDKFSAITEKKDLKDDSANFTITTSRRSCIILYAASNARFYLPYMETTWWLIWIVMALGRWHKFHAPSLPSVVCKLLHLTRYTFKVEKLSPTGLWK